MLKLSLKEGEYVDIGDDVRVVLVGKHASYVHLLIDAPKDKRIERSTSKEDADFYLTDKQKHPKSSKKST